MLKSRKLYFLGQMMKMHPMKSFLNSNTAMIRFICNCVSHDQTWLIGRRSSCKMYKPPTASRHISNWFLFSQAHSLQECVHMHTYVMCISCVCVCVCAVIRYTIINIQDCVPRVSLPPPCYGSGSSREAQEESSSPSAVQFRLHNTHWCLHLSFCFAS